jgi:two-component system sensor histidine kinase/response regulator
MPRILVVEDNKTNQLVDRQILARLGYAVEVANDGVEALDACSKGSFDAILMDVQMPKMDGYQTTARIREQQASADRGRTPIVGLSARAVDGDREAALAAGMDDYLTKPLDVDELRSALARALRASPVETPSTGP